MRITGKLYSFEIPERWKGLVGVRKKGSRTDFVLLREEDPACSGLLASIRCLKRRKTDLDDYTEYLGSLTGPDGEERFLYAEYGREGAVSEENEDLYWRLRDQLCLVFDSIETNIDSYLYALESVVKQLPDPKNYTFSDDSVSEYYADYEKAEEDFLDILESIPREVLREDTDLNEKVCRLAVEMDNAFYEGDYPYQDESCRIVSLAGDLYEEEDIPLRPVLKDAIDALRRESEEKREEKYKHLDGEDRLFYENLDLYERIVGRSAAGGGAEREREYLRPDGGFVKNCMLSFVKDLVYARAGLYHDSELWDNDDYAVDLDNAYEELSARLSPAIKVVRNACEYFYSENITVDVTDNIHLILVRTAPLKIIQIWVNKQDSGREHGKWLAPDRLGEFCDMVGHIREIYVKYEEIALECAAELRKRFGF